MITFTGYHNGSEDRVADKQITAISGLSSLSLVLKDGCSVQNPVLLLRSTSDINKDLNYFYLQEFDRWYFITDIRAIRDDLMEITGRTDVLSTAFWREDSNHESRLCKCKGIVYRSQSKAVSNLLLDDGYFKVKNSPNVYTHPFPNTFNVHNFVMMIAGT